MNFWERDYDCYLILGTTGTPWAYPEWQQIADQLNSITTASRGKGFLRVSQMHGSTQKWLKFGRTEWKQEHHAKWTHGSPLTNGKDTDWCFYFVEGAFPSLPQCQRDNCPPDLYFVVLNESFLSQKNSTAFNPRFFFALASDLPGTVRAEMERVVLTLGERYHSILTASIHRKWGIPCGSGFSAAIQDLSFTGLFKVGDYHARPVTLQTLAEEWKDIPKPNQASEATARKLAEPRR
jgi:hypothetical protein